MHVKALIPFAKHWKVKADEKALHHRKSFYLPQVWLSKLAEEKELQYRLFKSERLQNLKISKMKRILGSQTEHSEVKLSELIQH